MTFAELDIAPRTKGRVAKPLRVEAAGELTPADLALLASERGIKPTEVLVLRERHHALAKLLAGGMSNAEASIITGYDPSRISVLKGQPLFQQLMLAYRDQNLGIEADFVTRANVLALTVVNRLQEAVEEKPDMSVGTLLEIGKFTADRTNNGPSTKTQNLNVSVQLGDRMKAARERANNLVRKDSPQLVDVTPKKVAGQ